MMIKEFLGRTLNNFLRIPIPQVLVAARRFYLTGDTTNLYALIQGSLELPFSELFSANGSLWNQYKYIEFDILSFYHFSFTGFITSIIISWACKRLRKFSMEAHRR